MQQPGTRARSVAIVAALLACVHAQAAIEVRVLAEPADISPLPQISLGVLVGAPGPIAGKLGCRFMSGADNSLVIGAPSGKRLTLTPGRSSFEFDGLHYPLPAPAVTAGDQVICALRPVLEALGATVHWNAQAQKLDVGTRVDAIDVFGDEDAVRVRITTPLRCRGTLGHLADPERYYVDLPGTAVALEHEQTLVNCAEVLRVRWGQFKSDPPVTRIVADLSAKRQMRWVPAEDGLGGSLILGEPDGKEPLIERRMPQIARIDAGTPDENTTVVRVELTDPAAFEYDVQLEPPRVVLKFPDAAPATQMARVPVESPFVQSLRLSGTPGTPGATLTLDMRQLVHFEVQEEAAGVALIFRRGRLADKRIVIDPGHGGRDPGAVGLRLKEKDVNLDVARQVAAKLMEIGAQTVLSRESDVFVDLYDRPELANRISADLFVSIHCNAMPKRNTGHGTETYYYHARSKCLGAIVHANLIRALGRKDRGLRWANFCVTRESEMPAVLVELLFLNSDAEEALLESPAVRTAAANAIVEGLRQYVEGTGTLAGESELGM
jgi:N-acetylmuramoyl-L-alanine amidase